MNIGSSSLISGSIAIFATIAVGASAQASSSSLLDDKIAIHARKQGVPLALARAVIRLESNFRPGVVSRGNYGLMQIRLATARSLGYGGGGAGLLNAETNLTYGMKYLGKAYRMAAGDTCGAIMRYQSGLRAVRFSAANRSYCGRAKVLIARAD